MKRHDWLFLLELALMLIISLLFGSIYFVLVGELPMPAIVIIGSVSYILSMFIVFAIGSQRHGK